MFMHRIHTPMLAFHPTHSCNIFFYINKLLYNLFFVYTIFIGCWKGTWGSNCTDTCSSKCIDQHCYPGDGFCVWGCDPQNCRNTTCNNQTGVCTEGCVDGWVGQYCNTKSCKHIFV